VSFACLIPASELASTDLEIRSLLELLEVVAQFENQPSGPAPLFSSFSQVVAWCCLAKLVHST
jgi:hypothetical protein